MLVSIHLNSNQPEQICVFFDSIEETATDPSRIEVLVNIDEGDEVMIDVLEKEMPRRKFPLRYTQTALPGGFFDLWKPLNKLYEMTHPEAYYLLNVSDEFLFKTQGWDDIIASYIGYYPDHIFRLRCSQFRFRNYQDLWECGFAPDSLAFYTRKWLDAGVRWNPCFGPDSFQQCVAFYLYTSDPFSMEQYNRDIAIPHIRFAGEGASIGLSEEAHRRRTRGHVRTWMILMSPNMQIKAKRCAMWLKAHMKAHEHGIEEATIIDRKVRKLLVVLDSHNNEVVRVPYFLNSLKMHMVNLWRRNLYHYYAGGGREAALRSPAVGFLFYLWAKYDWYYRLSEYDWLYPHIVRRLIELRSALKAKAAAALRHIGVMLKSMLWARGKAIRPHINALSARLPSLPQWSVMPRLRHIVRVLVIQKTPSPKRPSRSFGAILLRKVTSIPFVIKQYAVRLLFFACFILLVPVELLRGLFHYLGKKIPPSNSAPAIS